MLLPNSMQGWERVNKFFRTNMHHNANIEEVNSEIGDMQNAIYSYFLETHGSVKERKKNPFDTNYRAMSKNETKRQLKTLENQTSQPDR